MRALSLVIAVFLDLGATTAGAQAISFFPPSFVRYRGGARVAGFTGMAIADFNKDGRPDIVYTVSTSLPQSDVLFGNADGSFRAVELTSTNFTGGAVYAADFTGDGNADILFSDGGKTRLLPGDGAGQFRDAIPVEGCTSVSAAADLNGDGRLDLFCGEGVRLHESAGRFRTAGSALAGRVELAADFNGDGTMDAVLLLATGGRAVVLGAGGGLFRDPIPVPGSTGFVSVLAGDFTGDGRADLVASGADGDPVTFLPGRGDGTFGAARIGASITGRLDAAADFNGDGKLDIVAGDALLGGIGDGTFRFPVFAGVVTDACSATTFTSPCGYLHPINAAADFNGDGRPDLVAGYIRLGLSNFRALSVAVLLNNSPGDGFLATGVSAATGTVPVGPNSLVSAFGVNLAPRTESASTNPAPTSLGGIRLHVRDRSRPEGWLAPLLYVSPSQINYVLDSDDPYAWVDIERIGSPYVAKAMVAPISPLAPGLFTLGRDLAAGTAVRLAPDGSQVPVPVTSCGAAGCQAETIDVSGDPVYLSLFGTGFSRAVSGGCRAANQVLPLTYAGPQTQFAGLDQINVLLPATLQGAGEIMISCGLVLPGPAVTPQPIQTNEVRIRVR